MGGGGPATGSWARMGRKKGKKKRANTSGCGFFSHNFEVKSKKTLKNAICENCHFHPRFPISEEKLQIFVSADPGGGGVRSPGASCWMGEKNMLAPGSWVPSA